MLSSKQIPVTIGRNGLARGIGLHDETDILNVPIKEEGDGKSPTGVFSLSSVFGYKPASQMAELRMPYIQITEMVECVDDASSRYYNKIVSSNMLGDEEQVDWGSSEKMIKAGVYYELGVVVDHNVDPTKKRAGSCIFLHNWSNPNERSAGCTCMAPKQLRDIVNWLDAAREPVLVQLTKQLYHDLRKRWALPESL